MGLKISCQFGGYLRHVSPLVSGCGKLVFAGEPPAVCACYGGGAVGRTAGDLVVTHLPRKGVRKSGNDHPLVKEGDVETEDCRLLPPMLGVGTGEHASHLA